MKLIIRSLMICLSGTLVASCLTSSPPVRYYALNTEAVPPSERDILVGIGPFELPDYLDRPQVVVRGQNERLIINEYDRWAENLETSMSRRIVATVSKLNRDVFVLEFVRASRFPPDYRALGQVTRFEATADNVVILEIAWVVEKVNATTDYWRGKRTTYEVPVTSSSNIDEVTAAMGAALDQFSADIAAELTSTIASAAARQSTDE